MHLVHAVQARNSNVATENLPKPREELHESAFSTDPTSVNSLKTRNENSNSLLKGESYGDFHGSFNRLISMNFLDLGNFSKRTDLRCYFIEGEAMR